MIQPDPLPDAEGNLTLPGSDDPDNPNVYAQQNLRDGDLSFTLRRGTRIIVARETSSVGLAFLANNITAEIEAGAEIFSPDRAVLVFADNIVVNNRGDIEATGTDGGSESFSVDTTSAFRLNNFGRIESRTGTSINIGILATGVQIHNEKGGRIIGGRGINSDGISESFGRGSRVSVEQEGDGLAAQVFNRGVIQTGTGTPGAFAVDLRRFGGLLENLGEGQIIGGVRMIGNRARLFNDGSIDAGNQRHNLAIDFGASPGSRTRILASNNRPVLNPNDRIFNTSQTLEIGPHSQINGTIRFGAKAADPEDATTSVPDVLKFVARDADENGTQDPFIDMNLLVIDDFDLDKTALPANRMVMVSEPLEGDELQEFIKAGFVGQDENGNLLQGEDAGRDLIVRRVALLATPAPIVPPVEPPESVDPEPMVQPVVPPVINPPDSDTNGQASGQQPDANIGQPDNTDGEQSSVQGMMVSGDTDSNGDTEPQMPVNPTPPDTATSEQPDGTSEQDNNQNRVVPNGVDQQGNNQGMVVSGTDNTDGNNQPAGPDGNGASEQPDTHTTQPDGEGNEGESAPPVPATPNDTTVPPQVVASEQTSRVFQAQFLAQTAERIFAAPTRRLGDTRPLASRFKVSRANARRPLTKLSTGLNLNGSDEQSNNSSVAWLSALGGQSRRHADGAEQVFAGLAVGTERLLNPEVLGGVYTGVLRSDQRFTSGRELHSKASFVGLYGRLERADTLMDLDIGVAYQRYKRQRRVLENGTVRMARADHGGWLLGAGLGIGQRLHLGARRSFTPLLRLRYSGAFDQGYTERGTQANLTVDNNVTHLLEGRLQGIYGQELAFTSGTGHLTLSMGALVRRASGNDRFSGSLFGQRFSHRLTGQKNSEYGGLLSLGFGIPVADRGRLFGRVEGVFLGRDDHGLSAVVGVQIDF